MLKAFMNHKKGRNRDIEDEYQKPLFAEREIPDNKNHPYDQYTRYSKDSNLTNYIPDKPYKDNLRNGRK